MIRSRNPFFNHLFALKRSGWIPVSLDRAPGLRLPSLPCAWWGRDRGEPPAGTLQGWAGFRQAGKLAMQSAIRLLENRPSPSMRAPFSEMAALKSMGASMRWSVSGSSKYMSLTTRR